MNDVKVKKITLDEQLEQVRKLWKNYDSERRVVEVSNEGPGHFRIHLKSYQKEETSRPKLAKVISSFMNIF